jgi:hypothetical protein
MFRPGDLVEWTECDGVNFAYIQLVYPVTAGYAAKVIRPTGHATYLNFLALDFISVEPFDV